MQGLAERRARLNALYLNAPRDVYFEAAGAAIAEYYLADPSNPYKQSGRSGGARRWTETRHYCVNAERLSAPLMTTSSPSCSQ